MLNAPSPVKKYFWDTDFNALDLREHKHFILERILELGGDAAVKWMRENFTRDDMLDALEKSRRISPKSRNYWNFILHK